MSHFHSLAIVGLLATVLYPRTVRAQDEAPATAADARADANTNAEMIRSPLPAVRADSPAGIFGDRGQLAISSDAGFSLSNTNLSGSDSSTTTLILRPAVDYFVIDSLSLGGFLGLEYTAPPGGSSTALSIGPRLGYNLRMSERFSLWPKVGLSFASTTEKQDATTLPDGTVVEENDTTSTSLQLNLFVPVLFHPAEHFFIGLGPALDLDMTGDNKATTIAARLTLGGWI